MNAQSDPQASGQLISIDPWIWTQVLSKWRESANRYIDVTGDLPYRHCEEAHTGLLAAAVWQAGGVAIVEYFARQNAPVTHAPSARGGRAGWLDLFAHAVDITVLVEAKFLWLKLPCATAAVRSAIDAAHREAAQQVAARSGDLIPPDPLRYSVVFIVAYCDAGRGKKEPDPKQMFDHQSDFLQTVPQLTHDWVAWTFPPLGHTLPRTWRRKGTARFIGVVAHGRQV